MDEKVTKPTIETVLERMAGMEERSNQRMDGINERIDGMEERSNQRMDGINERIDGMEERLSVRLDRIEGVANTTRGEMLDMRADFREWRTQLKEHIPALR